MKKRKVMKRPKMIISTIIMVVLLVISISTATFAWFSANTIVGTNTLSFTAQHKGDANISISWNQWQEGNPTFNEIELSVAQPLKPCIPYALPVVNAENSTLSTEFGAFRTTFRGATIGIPKGDTDPNATKKFNSIGRPEVPFVSNMPKDPDNPNHTQNYFYVTNHGSDPVNLIIYFKGVEGQPNENLNLVRMAIFGGKTPESLRYIQTIHAFDAGVAESDTPKTHYGQIIQGRDPSDFQEIPATENTTPLLLAGNNDFIVFALVAWYDGVYLDDVRAGFQSNIEVIFQGN